jgi:hypothetical protein
LIKDAKLHAQAMHRTAADMKLFKPAKEVLEPELYGALLAMNKAEKKCPAWKSSTLNKPHRESPATF